MEGNRREPQAAAVDQGGGEYTFPPRSPAALSSGHLLHRHDSGSVRVYVQGAASPLSGGRHGVGELQRLGQQSVFGAEAPQGRRHTLLANRCGSSTPESLLSEIPAKAGDLEATTISRAPRRLLLQHRPSGRLLRHGVGAGGPSIHDLRDPATVGRFLRFQEHPGPTLRLAYGLDPFPLLLRENDGTCVSLSTLANVFGSKLPSALPAARSTPAPAGLPAAPLYGRHSVPLQLPGCSLGVEGAGCGSIGASRIVSQPEEGPVGPWTADTSPGAGHRFSALRVSGPEGQTRKDIVTGTRPIVPRCSQQALGACEGVGSAGRPGTISVLGNPCCPVLSSRATRRHEYEDELVGACEGYSAITTGPGMVENGTAAAERTPNFQPRRNGIPAHGQQLIRMGSCPKRPSGGSGLLAPSRFGRAHHLQRAEGCAASCGDLSSSATMPPGAAARRQPSCCRNPDEADLPEPRSHERATEALAYHGRERHYHPAPLHSIGRKYLGRSIKSGAGRCRLATPPSPVPAVGQAIPAHHRQVRLWGECPAATLQFEVVGAPDGSRRLPSAAGLPVARGKQFLPSAVGPARRLGAEAAEEWSRGDSRGAFMARSLLASAAHGDGFGDQSVSAQPRAVSASSSASTRWARASKVERRGLPSSMPAWVHLRDSQVGQQQPSLTSITIGSYRPATAPVNARYTLLPPRSEARYHQGIKPKLEAWLGTDTVGQVAMELVLQRHCATTASSYGTGVRSFLSFCAEYSIDPAAVDSSHIQRYIAWMGLRGTVKAASLRNYLSAVNSFLRDNDREPIAQGKMVSDSLRALAARQEDTIVSAHRAPLPASVALKIYNLAVQLIHSSKLCNMSLLRACCATIFSYFFFNRSGTTRGILNKDVASSGTDLLFYERHTKGKAGLDDAARTLYTAGHPQMAALMDHFTAIKSAYCASQQVALPLCYFALPGEDPASWTSNTQTEWLSMAYTAVGCSPPAGFAWTSHSLRSGAACAAQAEGWSDSDLCKYGGWVVGSAALQEAYLKVPVRPCTGSLFFFGWLKTRLHSGQPFPL